MYERDAYWAGLFDGEGSVFIQRTYGEVWTLRATLSLTQEMVVRRLKDEFGGSVATNTSNARLHGWKVNYQWSVTGQKAADFLNRIYPHSLIKAQEIVLALEYVDQRPSGRGTHTSEQAAVASGYQDRLRVLKAG